MITSSATSRTTGRFGVTSTKTRRNGKWTDFMNKISAPALICKAGALYMFGTMWASSPTRQKPVRGRKFQNKIKENIGIMLAKSFPLCYKYYGIILLLWVFAPVLLKNFVFFVKKRIVEFLKSCWGSRSFSAAPGTGQFCRQTDASTENAKEASNQENLSKNSSTINQGICADRSAEGRSVIPSVALRQPP